MAKVLYSATMSVDGFITGPDGDMQCIAAGQLDEVLLFYAPVMLGDGTRLFTHPDGHTVRLERLSVTETLLATSLWFRVVP